ncbi:uncharacterized protein si:ch211-81a5.8 isoform X3 [Thalassophryne amazonica]|uniref:uncharacterized protein si:ch211-81a5.8 isoform X3 n=1 Tax=Thalassophryne amazonica TaxID=390379 RepID=UPI00147116E3|nr:uncharacterized protein si:ch211-81a5.8 isoform X3 [Thalassophryne amazonica]
MTNSLSVFRLSPGLDVSTHTAAEMASLMSLGAPFKQFTSCMSGRNTERGEKRSQSARRMSFTWRKSIRRRSVPCSSQKVPDSWLRVYQAELKKERKRQQAMLAKKNAERTVRKTHFRSHHCLPRSATAKKPVKGESFFGAFQGLNLDGLTLANQGSAAAADQCKVM